MRFDWHQCKMAQMVRIAYSLKKDGRVYQHDISVKTVKRFVEVVFSNNLIGGLEHHRVLV